jgi:hypothetical protein
MSKDGLRNLSKPHLLLSRSRRLSRREFFGAGLGALFAAVGGAAVRCHAQVAKVALIVPPPWLQRAFELIRSIQSPSIPRKRVRILGEVGDTRARIQREIDALSAQGGGTVSLAPGRWLVKGSLRMRSYVELHLEEGARVVFSGNRADYLPPVLTRWEGTDLYGYSPCLYAQGESDIALTGRGSLEMARGGDIESWRFDQPDAQRKLRMMGATGVPLEERVFAPKGFLRPSFIQFNRCEKVLVQGITVGHIPFWGVHALYSKHVTIRSIKVESDRVNNDGIDIDSSSKVLVEGCSFSTGDDCIAIKSGRDYDGRRMGIPSQDVVIRDCNMKKGGSACIAIGSEMSGGVRGVYIFRCTVNRVQTLLNIKSNLDRGGYVEGIRMWNLAVQECERLIQITTSYHGYMGGKMPPRFDDIEVQDVRCDVAKQGISIRGVPELPIKRIVLRDIAVGKVALPLVTSHVEQLVYENVQMNGARVG